MTGGEFETFKAAVRRDGGTVQVTASFPSSEARTGARNEVVFIEKLIYDILTPENVSLGHTWLKRKVKELTNDREEV
jgi:hypothetical protein